MAPCQSGKSVANFEREMIRERVKAGFDAANHRRLGFGRPKVIFDRKKAITMHRRGLSLRGSLQSALLARAQSSVLFVLKPVTPSGEGAAGTTACPHQLSRALDAGGVTEPAVARAGRSRGAVARKRVHRPLGHGKCPTGFHPRIGRHTCSRSNYPSRGLGKQNDCRPDLTPRSLDKAGAIGTCFNPARTPRA